MSALTQDLSEPQKNVNDALEKPQWGTTMRDELEALDQNEI